MDRQTLLNGLLQATQLLQQFEYLNSQQDALRARLTPPIPLKPINNKPIRKFPLIVVACVVGFCIASVVDALIMGFLPREATQSVVAMIFGLGLLFACCYVCYRFLRSFMEKRRAKRNKELAQQNVRIEAENARRKPQDEPIYAQIDALQEQKDQISAIWRRDIAEWYPTQKFGSSEDAQILLGYIQGNEATTMQQAIECYKNDTHRQRLENMQSEMVQEQKRMRKAQNAQALLTLGTFVTGAMTASSTSRMADSMASSAASQASRARTAREASASLDRIERKLRR